MPVSCLLKGRLGNQALIICSTISYALKHGLEYIIPEHTLNDDVWHPHFKYLSKPFLGTSNGVIEIKEQDHSYSELPFNESWRDSLIVLDGYFQSELYFKEFRTEILKILNLQWRSEPNTVSIHQRKTDYDIHFDKHPPCTKEYFNSAVSIMIDKGFKRFVVCSDDIKWCMDNFEEMESKAEFIYSQGNTAFEDMLYMSYCGHNIIANSTFSLFSHWLNRHDDKVCIAPYPWFGSGNSNLDFKDIYFENTIKIDAKGVTLL